jgi:hypothetical protein
MKIDYNITKQFMLRFPKHFAASKAKASHFCNLITFLRGRLPKTIFWSNPQPSLAFFYDLFSPIKKTLLPVSGKTHMHAHLWNWKWQNGTFYGLLPSKWSWVCSKAVAKYGSPQDGQFKSASNFTAMTWRHKIHPPVVALWQNQLLTF